MVGSGLRLISDLPERFRQLFSDYPCFNRVQSSVFDDILYSSCSLVITAPTGSGKTVLFELAIVKMLLESPDVDQVKAVYVAPVKALCSERFQDWTPRFGAVGVSCVEITGDSGDSADAGDIRNHQIILTTPEKWDSLTRRWKDNAALVGKVKLVMIDEVHLLNDPKRGPTLEAIVCRMKTVMNSRGWSSSLRYIAVSATIFNLDDLANWLYTSEPARFHRFGNETRPVTLKRVVKGFPPAKTPFLFDIQLSYKLGQIIREYSDGKPVLIFCSTRRGVTLTCKTLLSQLGFTMTDDQKKLWDELAYQIDDKQLKDFVKMGAGFHHAGLTLKDRSLMQQTFMQGTLPVLVATSTLAMGVNLPAHLVIIKSTHQYVAGTVTQYPESAILQMVGRAGRPQFDVSATVVIMTTKEHVTRYENLLDCKEVLESSLHLHLAEHLNSEIVLKTIGDIGVAMEWMRSTFLYQRAFKNPRHYSLSVGDPAKTEKDLEVMIIREFNGLQRAGLVELNENGMDISPTDDGRLMSYYYIHFDTFKLFADVVANASMKTLLKLFSNANELSEVQLRVTERRVLNELNVNKVSKTIRFTLEGKIKTKEMKIDCLTQACLGCLPIPDPSLQQEAMRIVSSLERIARCLTEYLSRKSWYCALLSAVVFHKCLHAKLWENSEFVARQLDRIGPVIGLTLVNAGKTTFEAIAQTHPYELDRIMNRGPPGTNVIEQIRHLPKYHLDVKAATESVLRAKLLITVDLENREEISRCSTAGVHHAIVIIAGDSNNRLLLYRKVLDKDLVRSSVSIQVSVNSPIPKKVFVHLISEQWVGLDLVNEVAINPMAVAKVDSQGYLPTTEVKPTRKAKKLEVSQGPAEKKKQNVVTPKTSVKTKPMIFPSTLVSNFDIDFEIINSQGCVVDLGNDESLQQLAEIDAWRTCVPDHQTDEFPSMPSYYNLDQRTNVQKNTHNSQSSEQRYQAVEAQMAQMFQVPYENQIDEAMVFSERATEPQAMSFSEEDQNELTVNENPQWQITKIMKPRSPSPANFDIMMDLTERTDCLSSPLENDNPYQKNVSVDENLVENVVCVSSDSSLSPSVPKKRKVTFFDGSAPTRAISTYMSWKDNPEDETSHQLSEANPSHILPPDETSNVVMEVSPKISYSPIDELPIGSNITELPAIIRNEKTLAELNAPMRFVNRQRFKQLTCEVEGIVGQVVDDLFLSSSQNISTASSWMRLHENVTCQRPVETPRRFAASYVALVPRVSGAPSLGQDTERTATERNASDMLPQNAEKIGDTSALLKNVLSNHPSQSGPQETPRSWRKNWSQYASTIQNCVFNDDFPYNPSQSGPQETPNPWKESLPQKTPIGATQETAPSITGKSSDLLPKTLKKPSLTELKETPRSAAKSNGSLKRNLLRNLSLTLSSQGDSNRESRNLYKQSFFSQPPQSQYSQQAPHENGPQVSLSQHPSKSYEMKNNRQQPLQFQTAKEPSNSASSWQHSHRKPNGNGNENRDQTIETCVFEGLSLNKKSQNHISQAYPSPSFLDTPKKAEKPLTSYYPNVRKNRLEEQKNLKENERAAVPARSFGDKLARFKMLKTVRYWYVDAWLSFQTWKCDHWRARELLNSRN